MVTVTGTRKFQNCNTRHINPGESAQQVRLYGDVLRYFIHRTHCDHYSPAFLWGCQSAYISMCKHNRSGCSNTSPQPPSHITNGRTFSWETSSVLKTNDDHLESINSLHEIRQSKHSTRRFWYKNANVPVTFTVRARANLTNHGLRRCPWHAHARMGREPGTKVMYPVLALARSGADDVTLLENKQGSKALNQNHGIHCPYASLRHVLSSNWQNRSCMEGEVARASRTPLQPTISSHAFYPLKYVNWTKLS